MPEDSGSLRLLTLRTNLSLDLTVGEILGIPDDLCWVVKWGALADLLSKEGPAKSVERASYCEQRWEQGLEIARQYTTVLTALSQDRRMDICTLHDLDSLVPSWTYSSGTPAVMGMANPEFAGLYPIPDLTAAQLTATCVIKAPMPASDADELQVAPEHLSTLLDYAQHLATLKVGGEEFAATQAHYERMIKAATRENERLMAFGKRFMEQRDLTKMDFQREVRRVEDGLQ